MMSGSALLTWVSWPILSFTLFSAPLFASVVSPLPFDSEFPSPVAAGENEEIDQVTPQAPDAVDYSDPNVWFPTKPQKKVVTPVNTYSLTIPKLSIENAQVVIAGDDLDVSLIHYGGTGLPGDFGNAVIFGHSVLPQFFNPKDYRTIFSTLPKLEIGDELYIRYDNVTYRYVVEDMTVRNPNDLSGLEQMYDDSYVTLITCVPPGTYWKRLNVRARLSDM